MKLVAHTGAACPIDVKRQMIEWFGPVFQDSYGATEVGTTCTISSAEWLEHPARWAGPSHRSARSSSTTTATRCPPAPRAGCSSRTRPAAASSTRRSRRRRPGPSRGPGVFTLGEIGYINDDGYVYITDRFSDMIVSGGVNIYPAEAEQVLIEHPEVADVAVIGVPDTGHGRGGEGARRAGRSGRPARRPTS